MQPDIKFRIDKKEVKRYLRYHSDEMDTETISKFDDCSSLIQNKVEPRFIYQQFQITPVYNGYHIAKTRFFLKGKSISRHLENSSSCYLLAATLGISMDRILNRNNKVDLPKAIICDACASTYIEEICDQISTYLQKINPKSELTSRFSPGYGDLSLENQLWILQLLDAPKKIGLTVSPEYLLIPSKSITAIIGVKSDTSVSSETKQKLYTKDLPKLCKHCRHLTYCYYLKRGEFCDFH